MIPFLFDNYIYLNGISAKPRENGWTNETRKIIDELLYIVMDSNLIR